MVDALTAPRDQGSPVRASMTLAAPSPPPADQRVLVPAGGVFSGRDAPLLRQLQSMRQAVVEVSDVRNLAGESLSPSHGSGFLAMTQCHIVTAGHVVARAARGPGELIDRLDLDASTIAARARIRADFRHGRPTIERQGTVVASGDLKRSIRDDWAVIRLDHPIPAVPFAFGARQFAGRGVVNVAHRTDDAEHLGHAVFAFHGDLAHRTNKPDLYAERCERIGAKGRRAHQEFRSSCIGAPGASGGPELALMGDGTMYVSGIVTESDRGGLDSQFGARGVPQALRPGRVAGTPADRVLPRLIAAIEQSPCSES